MKTLHTEYRPKPDNCSIQAVHVTENEIIAGDMASIIHIWKFSKKSIEERTNTAFKQKTSKRPSDVTAPKTLNKRSRKK